MSSCNGLEQTGDWPTCSLSQTDDVQTKKNDARVKAGFYFVFGSCISDWRMSIFCYPSWLVFGDHTNAARFDQHWHVPSVLFPSILEFSRKSFSAIIRIFSMRYTVIFHDFAAQQKTQEGLSCLALSVRVDHYRFRVVHGEENGLAEILSALQWTEPCTEVLWSGLPNLKNTCKGMYGFRTAR